MGLAALRPNQLIKWRDRLFKLVGRLPNSHWHMQDVTTGLIDTQSDETLWEAFEENQLTFLSAEQSAVDCEDKRLKALLSENAVECPPGTDDEKKRCEASHRWSYVRAVHGLTKSQIENSIVALHEKFNWPDKPPHPNSILNWRKKAADASDPISALVARDDRKGRHGDRYADEVLEIVRKVRDDRYLRKNPRITVAAAQEIVSDQIILENNRRPTSDRLQVPKRRLIEKVINEIPVREQIAKRYGCDTAAARFRNSMGGIAAKYPLDRCEVDHTAMSIILLDDDFAPWGRASISLALDVRTRDPTGIYLGAEIPSIVSVARCMRHSVSPKLKFMSRFPEVKGTWDCFGVHNSYIVDNGMEEHATALRQALSEMGGATLELCPRKKAWFKPHVERFFRTMDLDCLQGLPGATMENILTRSDFNPKHDLVIRKSLFQKIFVKRYVSML